MARSLPLALWMTGGSLPMGGVGGEVYARAAVTV
jgi:hypothetical protein